MSPDDEGIFATLVGAIRWLKLEGHLRPGMPEDQAARVVRVSIPSERVTMEMIELALTYLAVQEQSR